MLASWHVVLRGGAKRLLVAGVFSYSTASVALGLGDITVHSALNQPLKADIALVDVGALTQSDLSISLATADEFGRAGVERVFFLNDLKFTPILHGSRQLVRVTSSKPVNEPFLNFLVQLNQPNGRLLREYTVLIDPPGSPGIVPATDEPDPRPQSSEFPTVEPTTAPTQAAQGKRAVAPVPPPPPPATAASDALTEQLAASTLHNQQLQKTVDELNAKLQEQQALIADGKKQLGELQTRLTELQKPPPPAVVTPTPAQVAAPVAAADDSPNGWWLGGLLLLLGGLIAGVVIRRRRQSKQDETPLPLWPSGNDTQIEEVADSHPVRPHATDEHREEPAAGDVLEAVGIYLAYGRLGEAVGLLREALHKEPQRIDLDLQLLEVLGRQGDSAAYEQQEQHLRELGVEAAQLQAVRERHPKLLSAAPLAAVAPVAASVAPVVVAEPEPAAPEDHFELKLDELSTAASWDLEDSRAAPPRSTLDEAPQGNRLQVLPQDFELPAASEEAELEWIPEPEAQPLDDDFLNEFADPPPSLPLETLELQMPEEEGEAGAGKLEQAQTCIDDGDIDSAIALLNELLKEGDEPLRQTARTLLAGIR